MRFISLLFYCQYLPEDVECAQASGVIELTDQLKGTVGLSELVTSKKDHDISFQASMEATGDEVWDLRGGIYSLLKQTLSRKRFEKNINDQLAHDKHLI